MKKLILLLMIPIMLSGQTVTEKIKAKFKQINDAKIERLKECEEYQLFKEEANKGTLIWDEGGEKIYSVDSFGTAKEIKFEDDKGLVWTWQKDLPKRTDKAWVFETDWIFQDGTILLAYREETKTNYVCYDVFAKALVGMWDEYAKWVEEQPVTEDKWIVKKNGDIVNEGGWTKPSLDGFIEFLRNKLGELK